MTTKPRSRSPSPARSHVVNFDAGDQTWAVAQNKPFAASHTRGKLPFKMK